MASINFYFPDTSINEYSLGHIAITADGQEISSGDDAKNLMMVFISIVDLSDGIVDLLSNKSAQTYEFIGTDSSFRVLFTHQAGSIVITHPPRRSSLKVTTTEILTALKQCWQDLEPHQASLDPQSSVYQDLVDSRKRFQQA